MMLCVALWSAPVHSQFGLEPEEVELEDVIEIEILGRDVYAFDLLGTARPFVRLEIGEELLWHDSQGRVGMVLTDRRALAVSPGTKGWREVRYRLRESVAPRALIGKRVALLMTTERALGYDARNGIWLVQDIGPNEKVEVARVGDGTAVFVTNRNAYGLSPSAGGFFVHPMAIHEKLQGVRVKANMATIDTSQRLLVFRAPSGIWSSERRRLN
jgi:predicted RNA-binding protein